MHPRPFLDHMLRAAIVLASLTTCGLFLLIAFRRLHYPYELDELEGYMVLIVQRISGGLSMYPRPSLQFIPDMYPPLYFYVASAVQKLAGPGFAALRLTSIFSTLGTFTLIYVMVWREIRQHLPAITAVGLYAGLYPQCEVWFDRGRVDSFFVFTVVTALYCTRYFHPSVAALAWTAAFLTKQSIFPAAVVIICFDFRRFNRTIVGLATLALAAGGSVLWLQHATHGWYLFYVFTVPGANSDLLLRSALEFWPDDIFRPLGLALVIMASAFLVARPSLRSPRTRFYLLTLVVFPLFWFVRSHNGSSINAMMPVYAVSAILFGISLGWLYRWLSRQSGENWKIAVSCLLIATLIQVTAGISNPGRFRVNPEQTAAIASAIRAIQMVPGEVYVTQHPYYGVLAGKAAYADLVSIHDTARPANAEVRESLKAEVDSALRQHFSAIVVDSKHGDIERLDTILHLDPSWESRYSRAMLLPGVDPVTRPAWIMTASGTAKTANQP